MNPDHARFADWDSAYVLGALSPAERREYEEHLESCELVPAIRRRARPDAGAPRAAVARTRRGARSTKPDRRVRARTPATDLLDAVRRGGPASAHRRRTRLLGRRSPRRPRRRARRDRSCRSPSCGRPPIVRDGRVRGGRRRAALGHGDAHTGRVGHEDRARLPLRRRARAADAPADGWPYALVVVDRDGSRSEVSSWRASPERGPARRRARRSTLDDIASLEIRAIASGDVLMRRPD